MLHSVYFSPSGTTRKIVGLMADGFGMECRFYDVTVEGKDPILVQDRGDVVLFAAPVYAGRIPPLAAERFAAVEGRGQKAIAAIVYGNRDYDDALVELCDIVAARGFDVVAAGAFIGRHCIFPEVATARPDDSDERKIEEFVSLVRKALGEHATLDLGSVRGHRPYKKIAGVPLHPKADGNLCDVCGTCAAQCPARAIDENDPRKTDESRCIACCRCIAVCPKKARRFGGLLYRIAGWKFVKDNSRRLEPEWFV